MRFLTKHGIKKVQEDQALTKQCYMETLLGVRPPKALPVKGGDAQDNLNEQHKEPPEDLILVPLEEGNASKVIQVNSHLDEMTRHQLISFLQENVHIFAWSISDILCINLDIMLYNLNVDPIHWPVKQKKRRFAPKHQKAIIDEVDKFIKIGFIKEVVDPN